MKRISSYINEKLIINKDTNSSLKTINSYTDLYTLIYKTAKESHDGILSLPNVDASNLKDLSFLCPSAGIGVIREIKKIDFSNWDVQGVLNMEKLFYHLNVEEIDVTGWNVEDVTNVNNMFSMCKNLKKIIGIDSWKLKNISDEDRKEMFNYCPAECRPKWIK